MADVADNLRRTINRVRKIPAQLGLHPHTVQLELRTFSGGNTGRGTTTTTLTPLLENGTNPRVVWISYQQLVAFQWSEGTVRVGPFTPGYGEGEDTGGLTYEDLIQGHLTSKQGTVYLIITGPRVPDGKRYLVKELKRTNFRWELVAEPAA